MNGLLTGQENVLTQLADTLKTGQSAALSQPQMINGLAELYRLQGKYTKAEPLYQQALYIRERNLGPKHNPTREVQNNYAILLRMMGSDEEARKLEEGS